MLQPHPHCPGRLGPDPGVARGRGCRRRQRLGNILWTAGWTDWRVSPSRGRAEIGWGQSKLGPGWPDLGEGWQGEYAHTVTPKETQSRHTNSCHLGHRETANQGHTDRVRHTSGQANPAAAVTYRAVTGQTLELDGNTGQHMETSAAQKQTGRMCVTH